MMMDSIGIIGFLILLYTVYLILTEKKNDKDVDNNTADTTEQPTKASKDTSSKGSKKSAPVKTIEGEDDPDVLRQGKNYTEQSSSETPNVTPRTEQHIEEPVVAEQPGPSTKNQGQAVVEPAIETVSVKCPYCDNNVLVPKGGSAECSCCSSRLNDNGGIVE